MLEQQRVEVLSLDVFDTLLWRVVPEAVDAFRLFGQRLMSLGYLEAGTSPAVFAHLRERAEQIARSLVGPETGPQEVTLHQIYAQMPRHLFSGIAPAALADLEVDFEREITFPDLEILQLAAIAFEKFGARVVLVSDTYYSEEQIRRILDRDLFSGLTIDSIFTSSDRKVGKGSGLFGLVLDELGRKPAEVLHVGDHEHADVAAAGAEGIETVHYERFTKNMRTIIEAEGVFRGESGRRNLKLDDSSGDFGLTAVRSKSLGRPEVDSLGQTAQPFWRFGTAVLGPVFAAFAEWVHSEARARGHSTVFCLMREGEFLTRLLDGAGSHVHDPVEARRFWASRQVTARAAIFDASPSELKACLQRRRPPTVRQFLEGLGLGISEFPQMFSDSEGRLDDPRLLERLLMSIEDSPEARAAIVDDSAAMRRRLLAYVQREAAGQDRLLVADLGWGATIQANLQRVFDGSGLSVEVEGLYLATNDTAADRVLAGLNVRGFLANAGVPGRASKQISRSPEIIEQVFMHDVGSLVDYTADGQPVCGEACQDPVQVVQRAAVQSGIMGFQSHWARYSPLIPKSSSLLAEPAREQLLAILQRFIVRPSQEEAAMFSWWLHDDNYGSEGAETVVSSDLRPQLKYMTPQQYLALPSTRAFWPFGLASICEPALAAAAAAVAEDLVPASVFLQSEQHYMPIFIDDGSGFEERLRTPTRINGAGLCFATADIGSRAAHSVRLAFPGGPGIVRIDRLALSFSISGEPDPIVVLIEKPADFAVLRHDHAEVLSPNVLLGRRQAPQVIYDAPRQWRDLVYKVEVEAAFAWLPVARMAPPAPTTRAADAARRAARVLMRPARPDSSS